MNIEFLPLPNGYEWYKCPLHSNTATGGNQSHVVLSFKADWPFPVKEEIWTPIGVHPKCADLGGWKP